MATFFESQSFAAPIKIDEAYGLDDYAKHGAILSRDSVSTVIAALKRDAYEMRQRGGEPNNAQADINDVLALNLYKSVR